MKTYYREITYYTERHMMMVEVSEHTDGKTEVTYRGNPTGDVRDRAINKSFKVDSYKEGLKRAADYIQRKGLKITIAEKDHDWYEFK